MRLGHLEITPLPDAEGEFLPWLEAFPSATDADWTRARAHDPGAFGPGGRWHLNFRCFAIRGAGVTLVDLGIGHAASPAGTWAPVPGRLPASLAGAGIEPSEVDTVVLTHLHADHCGWAVTASGEPLFPNARHVLHRDEVRAANDTVHAYAIRPLRESGLLDEVDGETVLARTATGETVTAVPTPGHTPGHQSVLVASDTDRVVIAGDVLVHPVQLVAPDVAYRYDDDQDLARATRRALLAEAERTGTVLASPHLSEAFQRVPAPTPSGHRKPEQHT